MIDRNLNYGRHHIENFCSDLTNVSNIVDLGAGKGTDLLNCKRQLNESELFGLEWDKENIETLLSNNISVFQADLEKEKLPFSSENVDLIIMNQIFEHLKEIFWVFHEVSRVLSVNGHMIIGFPNLASLHNRLLLLIGKQPTSMQTFSAHIRGATKNDFIKFLDLCFPSGFELIKHKGSNFYPFPPAVAKPAATIFPNMAYGTFLLLKKKKSYNDEFLKFPIDQKLETNFFTG